MYVTYHASGLVTGYNATSFTHSHKSHVFLTKLVWIMSNKQILQIAISLAVNEVHLEGVPELTPEAIIAATGWQPTLMDRMQ